MAQFWLPGDSDFARALCGWPSSPRVKPKCSFQIDWSNIAAPTKDKEFHILFNENGGTPNAFLNKVRTPVTLSSAPNAAWVRDGFDLYASGVGSSLSVDPGYATGDLRSAFTYILHVRFNTAQDGAFDKLLDSSGEEIQVRKGTYENYLSLFGVDVTSVPTSYWYDGLWHTLVVSRSGGFSETTLNGWLDGTRIITNASHSISIGFGVGPIYIGSDATLTSRGATVGFAGILNRVLPFSLQQRISEAVFSVVKPANYSPYPISVPAGGGATLTVQSATHSHSAESPSLVQAHALTPVDALHSHAAESPSLTQANALNPSDSAHDHSAEQPSLSSASIIAAADALHGHTAEQPSVIQAHVLAVVSAAHAHTADNVTLTVGGTLAPDDALHGHLVDAPTLTQAGVLAPDGALHGHTAEQSTLVQANSLSPDDAAHAHSAGQPTIDISVFVSAADSTHGHAADSPALTQANLLAVADAVHAHLADSPALSQHITVVASDALHAHLSESPNIVLGTLPLMSGRVYLSRATLRVYRPVKRLDS